MPDGSRTTITVALSTYNGGAYAREQVESILAQTSASEQVVVGDDGSSDGTYQYVLDVAGRAGGDTQEWVVLPSEHSGIRGNKLRILQACTQDVIVWCDHDDVCLPDRVERIRAEFDANPGLLLVHCDADLIDSAGHPLGRRLMEVQGFTADEQRRYADGRAFEVLAQRSFATGATIAFRRELLDLAGPNPDVWVFDEWYAIIAAALQQIGAIPTPVIRYRQHPQNKQGVRRRGVAERVGLLLEHGGARNRRQLARAQALQRQIRALGEQVPGWVRDLTDEKLRHEIVRARYPRNRLVRVPHVVREAATGAYTSVARGSKDVLLDLLQPTA